METNIKWRTDGWYLLRNNAPETRSFLVKDFLANNNVTTLECTPLTCLQLIFTFSVN
jgi:hypothetical protein